MIRQQIHDLLINDIHLNADPNLKKLNLGCGADIKPGWINCDYVPASGVDHVIDLTRPLPFPDSSADEIYASHVLEHIPEPLKLLLECHRVLKSGGTLIIRVPYGIGPRNPDLQHIRYFWPHSLDIFFGPTPAGLDARQYNNRFVCVKRRVLYMIWPTIRWGFKTRLHVSFFDSIMYRVPFGHKKEIVWSLKKV